MVYKGLIRKRKIEQQEQFAPVAKSYVFWLVLCRPLFISEKRYSCCSILRFLISEQNLSEINNGLQSTNQKREIEQQEQSFSEINNGLQSTNQKRERPLLISERLRSSYSILRLLISAL
jgi:hypothetical protein